MLIPEEVKNIRQEEYSNSFTIFFTYANHEYSLLIHKPFLEGSKHRLTSVYHKKVGACPLCQRKEFNTICEPLFMQLPQLFEQLTQDNRIRLEWLFREYEWVNRR